MRRCYFSKSYRDLSSAGSKAKTDIEQIMADNGFVNVGSRLSVDKSSIRGFLKTLFSVLKLVFNLRKGDNLVVQYPFKKYYALVCNIAHLRQSRVVTIIHDLGSFRRKKLTITQEIKRLEHSDVIIAHNTKMHKWLIDNGCIRPIFDLNIFDYLSKNTAPITKVIRENYEVTYAGALSYRKNKFLYQLEPFLGTHRFNLYGSGFEEDKITFKDKFRYNGFVHFEDLIATPTGDFGLVWDGESTSMCAGTFGEYLRYNNPHKISMYIRCHLPVIVWGDSAMADFVMANKVGIKIDSLEELNEILASISTIQYEALHKNTIILSKKLASGHFFMQAYLYAEKKLG